MRQRVNVDDSHDQNRLEVEVTFRIQSVCNGCDSDLDWCKQSVKIDTPVDMDRIELWFRSGAALHQLRVLLQHDIPPAGYLKTLRSLKKRSPGSQ